MKQFVKVGHRNGAVFLRIVSIRATGRESVMIRLTPKEAGKIGNELWACSAHAERKHVPLKMPRKKKPKVKVESELSKTLKVLLGEDEGKHES